MEVERKVLEVSVYRKVSVDFANGNQLAVWWWGEGAYLRKCPFTFGDSVVSSVAVVDRQPSNEVAPTAQTPAIV